MNAALKEIRHYYIIRPTSNFVTFPHLSHFHVIVFPTFTEI